MRYAVCVIKEPTEKAYILMISNRLKNAKQYKRYIENENAKKGKNYTFVVKRLKDEI